MNQPTPHPEKKRIALVVFRNREGKHCLHFRDGNPGIAHPLQWSLFGGHVEPGEGINQAGRRELAEEIDVDVPEEEIDHLDTLEMADRTLDILDCRRPIEWSEIRLQEGAGCGFFNDHELARLQNCSPLVDWLRKRIGVLLENNEAAS